MTDRRTPPPALLRAAAQVLLDLATEIEAEIPTPKKGTKP